MAALRLFAIFLYALTISTIQSAKIVGLPMMGGSQYIGMKRIGQELVNRGHEFTILVSSIHKIKPTEGIIHKVYKVPYENDILEKLVGVQINQGLLKSHFYSNETMSTVQGQFCESMITSKDLIDPLKDFDLLITDSSFPCGHLLADYLEINKVEYCPVSPRVFSVYNPYESLFMASYVPMLMSFNPGNMNLLQRVKNTVVLVFSSVMFPSMMLKSLHNLKVKYNIKPEKTMRDSVLESRLVLFLSDFALEYVYPIPPHYKMVGPVNIQPVKPLPPDLKQLIDSSGDDGAIIVSFGSNVASMTNDKVDIMAEAFGKLKQKVIWRLKGYIPSSLSPNIKPVGWLPQSDLLAHEKLKLFVTHAGQNSMYEAAYRGVPVVAIPLFGDQFDNALVIETKEIGVCLNFHQLTADQLYNAITRVIREKRFRENVQHISRVLSDRPRSPVEEAGDWIEYSFRHESLEHLRPQSSQLTWYQYFLVDVAVFLVLVLLLVLWILKTTARLLCWMCCRRNKKQKTQ